MVNIFQFENLKKLKSNFEKKSEPILIKNFLKDYNLRERITFEELRKVHGFEKVYVGYARNGLYKLDPKSGTLSWGTVEMNLDEYLDGIDEEKGREYYLQQIPLKRFFPDIFQEIELGGIVSNSSLEPNLWIGPKGTIVHLHFDWPNNFYLQIKGEKRFILYSPNQTKYLYPYSKRTKIPYVSQVDIHAPDLENFPKFIKSQSMTFDLDSGDALYIPPFWWHQVHGESSNISVSILWSIKFKQIPLAMYAYFFHEILTKGKLGS